MKEEVKKKNIKEFKNIYRLVKNDKVKLGLAFICILISSLLSISNGYLQGEITEYIIALNLKAALFFLGIYFAIGVLFNNFLSNVGVMLASKIDANLSRNYKRYGL